MITVSEVSRKEKYKAQTISLISEISKNDPK